jgi:ATP-dependent Clp protease, protease subunit
VWVEKAVERDNFMSPEEAVKFGLIDKVIQKRDDLAQPPDNPDTQGTS